MDMGWMDCPWNADGMCPADWFNHRFDSFVVSPFAVLAEAKPWADAVSSVVFGGIYFLVDDDDGELSYVGISSNVAQRLYQHSESKRFTRVYAHRFPMVMARELEEFYIEALNPRDNTRVYGSTSVSARAAIEKIKAGAMWPGWEIPQWVTVVR